MKIPKTIRAGNKQHHAGGHRCRKPARHCRGLDGRGNDNPIEEVSESDLFMVERGGFGISIPASGDLTSLDVVKFETIWKGPPPSWS